MLPMSAAALAALPRATRRTVRAEWSNDGGRTWTSMRVSAASVTPDRTAECRYSASAEAVAVPLGRDGINTVVTQVRLFEGIAGPRSDLEWVPAGRYVVDRVKETRTGASLSLLGREDAIRSADFPTTRTVGPDTARVLAEQLIAEALPGTAVSWRSGVKADQSLPAVVVDEDRWAALSGGTDSSGTDTGIAAALGAEVWADARGVMVFSPVPTLADPVVWRVPYGQGLVEPAREQSSEGLVNVWSISGDAGDGAPAIGPLYVWDDDPNSLTYAGPDPVDDPLAPQRLGLTGVRLRVARYASPLITDTEQGYTVGRAKLADSLGIQASLSFTAYSHPGLEPGDVVEVEVSPGVWERHIIDSCPRDLSAASMTCTTRTSTRRL